ncbi:phenylalanine 4-monooxygenase [Psychrobium sp. 1_MG-2023]|uniref:phenylalanine 4-monooxygenase n=1 Tax=Psychrobium sp. 1_MG-2023 TaxID=3062624 RepID=UPI000C335E50|nr:phenylalanine 4-monooxygenase [Psychrobium sp. 1_MG-2023]MDP2562685.1 phenylalanine 4-monooxygenase [Psychrobium sp. 1_MG-2023]PKF54801.1 phenylalanine 4-monooxygenase [Alteromonadales bacterium alter-6D02]
MSKGTKYKAKQPDENGYIDYTAEENGIWAQLISRQMKWIDDTACEEFIAGLKLLNLPMDRVPQLSEINEVLKETTGWQTEPVPALIGFEQFFRLLSEKKFPVATFIRSQEELDYLQEPDIFHEIFGHCAMLTNPHFANFTEHYGKLGLAASKEQRVYLARLYWFTVEFGLVRSHDGLRIIGGGILSSPGETQYAYRKEAEIAPLEPLTVFRTPYRIDILQPQYFVVDDLEHLTHLTTLDLMALVDEAMTLGLLPAKFEPKALCG